MKRFSRCLLAAVVSLSLLSFGAPISSIAATATIPGLQPTTEPLDKVLALYHQAEQKGEVSEYSESWTESNAGLTGAENILHDGRNYEETDQLGPFTYRHGRYHGQRWFQNENGYTVLVHGVHQFQERTDETLRSAVNADVTSNVQLLGEVTTPTHAYVIQISPPEGRRSWLFIDATTGDVVRADWFGPSSHYTETFDDYRTVHGIRLPWHIHGSDGFSQNDDEEVMISFVPGPPTDPRTLQIPHDSRVVAEFPVGKSTVQLPVTIDDDQEVIVHASIDGHGADFLLDSGSDGIVIDDQVARKLGLTTYGTTKETMAATYTAHRTIIPELKVGDLRMHNIEADALPFSEDVDDTTTVVGLLGFDFIADMVVHIDYHDKKVEAIRSDAFTAPSDAVAMNVDLDDMVPYVSGGVGGVTGGHLLIDTGAAFTMIFRGFALAHPDAVHDQGLGRQIRMNNDFDPELEGVGNGTFTVQPAQVKNFQVGPLNFTEWLLMVGDNPPTYEEGDEIGAVGQDFLFLYDVYFDYVDSTIYFSPNADFHKYFKM